MPTQNQVLKTVIESCLSSPSQKRAGRVLHVYYDENGILKYKDEIRNEPIQTTYTKDVNTGELQTKTLLESTHMTSD